MILGTDENSKIIKDLFIVANQMITDAEKKYLEACNNKDERAAGHAIGVADTMDFVINFIVCKGSEYSGDIISRVKAALSEDEEGKDE